MAEKIIPRIDGVLKLIKRIQMEINGLAYDDFITSEYLPEAISFSIMQIGERMNKLEELLSNKYPDIPWKKARNMRNIIVHDYDNVDFKKVYLTATEDIPILKEQFIKIKNDILHLADTKLETERLIIRPWDDLDADELFELAKEPEIGYWCGFKPHKTIGDTFFVLHNILETEETYAICLKEKEIIIGSIGLDGIKDGECSLGFWIGKPFWGNGYVVEAAKEVLRHAFEDLKLSKVWCGYYEGNFKSKHVQEKLGFVYSHTIHDKYVKQLSEMRISYESFLTSEQWLKNK